MIEKNEMTVSEGLSKLKLLDKRIMKAMRDHRFVGYKIGSKVQENFDSADAKSSFQSVQDLISYRIKLKMAINKSNLQTKVKIANSEMTVLEAIENKTTIMYKKNFLQVLRREFRNIQNDIEEGNERTQERLDSQVSIAFEKSNKKEIDDFTQTFLRNNGYDLEDPIDISKTIETLDKEIDEFESEVDFILSTSNATTIIKL